MTTGWWMGGGQRRRDFNKRKSSGTGAHATVLPMFPQSPPVIPYGGFSPIRLEAGFRRSRAFPSMGLLGFVPLSPGPTLSRGLVALAGNPLTVSLDVLLSAVPQALAQHGLSYPRLQTLLRPDSPV